MKTLLVLAGCQQEYVRWLRENKREIEAKGLKTHFVSLTSVSYLGFRDCLFTEIGTFYRSARHDEIYRFFESHNIIKI